MGNKAHTCTECVRGTVEIIGIDEEGMEMREYYCEGKRITEAQNTFGCGLWRSKE